jgi:hypothetical protein
MPNLKRYRGFISHAWDYNEDYYTLDTKLKNYPNFDWYNYSVPKHDALDTATDEELEQALKDQIRPTNIVLILAGMYVNHRKWIQKEIEIAQSMQKPIIGIKPRGQQKIPQAVQDAAIEMVGWNIDNIVRAIRDHAK